MENLEQNNINLTRQIQLTNCAKNLTIISAYYNIFFTLWLFWFLIIISKCHLSKRNTYLPAVSIHKRKRDLEEKRNWNRNKEKVIKRYWLKTKWTYLFWQRLCRLFNANVKTWTIYLQQNFMLCIEANQKNFFCWSKIKLRLF